MSYKATSSSYSTYSHFSRIYTRVLLLLFSISTYWAPALICWHLSGLILNLLLWPLVSSYCHSSRAKQIPTNLSAEVLNRTLSKKLLNYTRKTCSLCIRKFTYKSSDLFMKTLFQYLNFRTRPILPFNSNPALCSHHGQTLQYFFFK